jgi:2-dehydro-3-deoxyphosphogluconate aldolase/(4S)-4-hydroxy-2-oxoglutarate aldolase
LLERSRLVAILRLDNLSDAVELTRSLFQGGVVVQEYTLTNPLALQAIQEVRTAVAEFGRGEGFLGVGSVRTRDQAAAAVDAGAQFIVSPILNEAVIEFCSAAQVPCIPGALTPTEIARAWELGASYVKVFPARSFGPAYIKDVLAPMPELKLLPTGGIDLQNMDAYFHAGATAVGIGGQLLDVNAIADKDWEYVTAIARKHARAAQKR